jgi:hypothetical protein
MSQKRGGLVARFQKLNEIGPDDVLKMHEVFVQYYDTTKIETFLKDLSNKEGAIIVREKDTGIIRGFSTVRQVRLHDGGLRPAIGVFSGDTILDHRFWGDRALKDGFVRYLLNLYLTNGGPAGPRLYWLLISKGYKTYLLLANNWHNYYPRWDKPNDPNLRRLVELYCNELFPGSYDAQREVLDFGQTHERLKGEVAPITDEERRSSPAIRYFEERNPEWRRGVELPCIGEISFNLLFPYLRKEFSKSLSMRPPQRILTPERVSMAPPAPAPRFDLVDEDRDTSPQRSDPWNEDVRASRGDA